MKKTLMVSNSWRPEDGCSCGRCGSRIEYGWGDYSFRYYELKDRSDEIVLCKSCASSLSNNDKSVRIVNRSYIMDLISLKNSGWKSQPKRKSGAASAEVDPQKKEEAE